MKISWCMVPEIWSPTDRIFSHLWTIFCPLNNPENQNFEKNEKNVLRYHFTQVHHN